LAYISPMQHLRKNVAFLLAATALGACSNSGLSKPLEQPDSSIVDPDGAIGSGDALGNPNAPIYCDRGQSVLGVTPPEGYCLKYFAQVGEARSLSIAPNGDVFVGAPSRATSGGATNGPGGVMVLSDDNHDGIAETTMFAGPLPDVPMDDVHAVVVSGGYVYFTTQATIWRTPYTDGQRIETPGKREDLGLPKSFGNGGRWTHGLARSAAGQLIATRGEYGVCGMQQGGEIDSVGAGGALTKIAGGFRNPMYVRCHAKDEVCAANELGEDLTPGAREKLIMLRPGTMYGYPCCGTKGAPAPNNMGVTDCADVTAEDRSFPLQDTPFGLDWEPGIWDAPYKGAMFVALHGSAYSSPPWQGARIVYAAVDPQTHAPVEGWKDFLGQWGPGGTPLERPADVAFAPDGRLYIADDTGGRVFWMAPKTLMAPGASQAEQ
jgi:glucose/arabinose dehydrogenase